MKRLVLFFLGVIGFVFVGMSFIGGGALWQHATNQPSSLSRTGTLDFDLGTRTDSYGSTWQAKELLTKIQQNPSVASFRMSAKDTTGARVDLLVDLRADDLTRTHSDTGKTERWHGDVMKRLQSAARGGTFNDT